MKSANQVLNSLDPTSQNNQQAHSMNTAAESSRRLAIADAMQTLVSMRLLSFQPGTTEYAVWEAGLIDLAPAAIKQGVIKARDCTDFLTLPRFRELCHVKPSDFGMPDARAAYVEACNKQGPKDMANWSHPSVYWAGVETGWFDLRTRTERETFPLFERNYEVMCARAIAGERLDMPVQKVLPEHHTPVLLTPEQNKRRCGALRELLA